MSAAVFWIRVHAFLGDADAMLQGLEAGLMARQLLCARDRGDGDIDVGQHAGTVEQPAEKGQIVVSPPGSSAAAIS